jgi:ABC-type multidrug transport system ATPase subunit
MTHDLRVCFAGKSTTISVLIGRLRATLGAQYIAGENVIDGLSKVHRFIGVCPQFDVVWSDLTVAEHLSFQARQRGIPANLVRMLLCDHACMPYLYINSV